MFEKKRLGDHGTGAIRQQELGNRGEEMDKENGQVAHAGIVAGGIGAARRVLFAPSMR